MRFQTAFWKANTTVYELVASDCQNIYVMQSVFLGRPESEGITLEDLPNLAEMLALPEGWIYRSHVLTDDLTIVGVDGVTPVLSDNLRNSYSQMDTGFDTFICPPSDEPTSAAYMLTCFPLLAMAFMWFINL